MNVKSIINLQKLCIHTITTKPWPIEVAAKKYAHAGVKGISVWRSAVEDKNITEISRLIRNEGLEIVSYVRGGFFPHHTVEGRRKAIDENKRIIDEAAELGAPLIVLVCGADPKQSLSESRKQIIDGIAAVLPHARDNGIKLAIEPLHPMYADNRSAINTLKQANDACEQLATDWVGVAVDVYHVWWDPDLEKEIQRCGKMKKIFAFHICDWKTPTTDILNDRGLMGEGCIPIPRIRDWVENAGFNGFHEVEIFSNTYWAENQDEFLTKIINAYKKYV